MNRNVFLFIYLLSGAAALLYEVLWLRLLTLSMGHTAAAVGILLAAFMGGLAVGAWGAGRIAVSLAPSRALRAYAALEIGIATYALLLPVMLALVRPVLTWAYADGNAGRTFDVTLAVLSLLLLAVPAAAMGATYPFAIRWFGIGAELAAPGRSAIADRPASTGLSGRAATRPCEGGRAAAYAGGLYAANTAGAAAGAALTGFVLLPLLGARATTVVGVALNAIAAVGALALARRPDVGSAFRRTKSRLKPAPTADAVLPRPRLRAAAGALGISGLVALVYQVTWTRLLAMVLGPTTYAFGAMLVAVITGLAIGSAIASAHLPRTPARAAVWLGRAMIAGAAAALIACVAVDRLPLLIAQLVSRPDVSFGAVLSLQIALVIAIQLPMSVALGAAFPLAIALSGSEGDAVPRDVSLVYATNTVGAIAGAIAASFVLIPTLGIQSSIRLAAVLAIATGVAVSWRGAISRGGRVGVTLAGAATTILALAMPEWNRDRLANGGYRYATALAAGDLETGLEAGRLVYYREGAAGTVSVRQVPGALSLAIDGKVDASNAGDMLTQKLLAHLPLLLHPNPRRVCVIGLGSGVTLGAALKHPVERADVVEISPEVVAASAFFAAENHDALADPRTRTIMGDGRAHLLHTTEQYDVIISEPSNPWMAGVASLFTREFFHAARARLAPDGLLTQWAHTYNITDADLRSIVATFLSVFPDGTAWLVGESDLLLIGGAEPIAGLERGVGAAWERPGVAADLAEVSVRDPFSMLSTYLARGDDLQRYAAGAIVQSDDRLLLEYSAPQAIYGQFQRSNVERLRDVAREAQQPAAVAHALAEATAVELRNRGLMQLKADAIDLAYADLREAVRRAPADAEALHGLARAAARSGRLDEVEKLLSVSPSVPALIELSIVRAALGRMDEATEAARQAVLAEPTDRAALKQLASMYADQGGEAVLERLTELVERSAVDRVVLLYCRTRLAYLRGDFDGAVRLGEELAAVDTTDVNVLNLLGSAYAALGRHDRARQALEASLRITPAEPGVLVNLGTVALRSGDPAAAAERFSEALFVSPTLPAALNGLADALERQGKAARAAAIRGRIPAP